MQAGVAVVSASGLTHRVHDAAAHPNTYDRSSQVGSDGDARVAQQSSYFS